METLKKRGRPKKVFEPVASIPPQPPEQGIYFLDYRRDKEIQHAKSPDFVEALKAISFTPPFNIKGFLTATLNGKSKEIPIPARIQKILSWNKEMNRIVLYKKLMIYLK